MEDAFTVMGDVTYEFFDIPVDTPKITLPFYAGAGAKIATDGGGNNNNQAIFEIRVPMGIAVQWTQYLH